MKFIGISVAKIAKWTVRIDVVSGVMENLSSKQGFKRSACGRLGRQTVERPIVRAAVQLAAQPASCSPGNKKASNWWSSSKLRDCRHSWYLGRRHLRGRNCSGPRLQGSFFLLLLFFFFRATRLRYNLGKTQKTENESSLCLKKDDIQRLWVH